MKVDFLVSCVCGADFGGIAAGAEVVKWLISIALGGGALGGDEGHILLIGRNYELKVLIVKTHSHVVHARSLVGVVVGVEELSALCWKSS